MERKWWTLLGVCVATFMLLVDVTIVNVALPSIQRDLQASLTSLQWVVDAYAVTLAGLLLTTGTLADRLGRRLVFATGVAIFTVASLACGLANTPTFLNVARGVQGIGGAAMFATSLALIAQEFEGRERGTAIAVWGATVGIAVAVGPLVGGALTEWLSWSWIFFVNVPIGLFALVLARTQMRDSLHPDPSNIDAAGLVTFSGGLFLLVLGLLRGNSEGWTSGIILGALIGAVVLLVAFVVIERSQRRPMFDLSLFAKPTFSGVSIATLAIGAGMFAMFLYVSIYLQDILHYSPLAAGLRFLPLSALVFAVPLLTRRLSQRAPARAMLGVGLALVSIGLLLMHGLSDGSSWTALLGGFVVAGVGIGLANPAIGSTAIAVVEPMRAGMASGINNTCRMGGVAVGIAALGAIFQHKVTTTLTSSLPGAPSALGRAVASSGTRAAAHVGRGQRVQAIGAARHAFIAGLNEILLVGAGIVFVGACAAFLLIRAQDFQTAPAAEPAAETVA